MGNYLNGSQKSYFNHESVSFRAVLGGRIRTWPSESELKLYFLLTPMKYTVLLFDKHLPICGSISIAFSDYM